MGIFEGLTGGFSFRGAKTRENRRAVVFEFFIDKESYATHSIQLVAHVLLAKYSFNKFEPMFPL